MKLYYELILSISLTGTIPFCIYLLLRKRLEEKIGAVFQYRILKCILVCFFFPFGLLKSILANYILQRDAALLHGNGYLYLNNAIIQTRDGLSVHLYDHFPRSLLLIWIAVLGLVIGYYVFCYLRFRRNVHHLNETSASRQKDFSDLKRQMKIRRSVSLHYCEASAPPFTCGSFRPCIVLTPSVSEEAADLVMRHELQHIRSHDFFWRTAAFAAVLIHCWNPFIYLLWKEMREISELACDEKVTKGLSSEEIRLYGGAIIQAAAVSQWTPAFVSHFADNNKKSMLRRIRRLGRRSRTKRPAAAFLFAVFCLAGFCIPAVACAPEVLYFDDFSISDYSSCDWVYVDIGAKPDLSCPPDEQYFQYTDSYLLTEDGSVVILPSDNEASKRAAATCKHIWEDVFFTNHLKDQKGGCTVSNYSARACKKCRNMENIALIYATYYTRCPH